MKTLSGFLLAIPLLLRVSAWAVEPHDITIWGFQFIPTLTLAESYDDNFRELDENERSSWVTRIAPGFELIAEDRNSAYRLTYAGNRDIYHAESDASHTDTRLSLDSIMEFTDRHRLELEAFYRKAEEPGSTAVIGENDKYHLRGLGGAYRYGAETARNQLEFGLRHEELRYDNRDDINAGEERDSDALIVTWLHRIGGGTRALLEYRHTEYDYVLASSPLNSSNDALLLGASWEATARTTGKLLVGYEQKDFDDPGRDDLDSPMWEAGIDWEPRTYSKFSLTARQAFDEGDDGSDAIKTTSATLAWRHEWSGRLVSDLLFGLARHVYEGQQRDDDFSQAGIGLTYSLRRWLDVSLGYRYRNNDSNAAGESYQRNVYKVSVTGSL